MAQTAEPFRPDAVCDGGDLDCGSGLLLIIRDAMRPLLAGGILEVRSREGSVKEDLPAWCRMVGHTLVASQPGASGSTSYFIQKKAADEGLAADLATAKAFTWTARVRWTEGMQAKAFVRNHVIPVGQPASFETHDPAPSAVEYLLTALGGCLAVGFQWRAARRGIAVGNLEVSLKTRIDNILVFLGVEAEGHPGFGLVEGSAYVEADAEDDVLEAVWEETVLRSPVAQSLLRQVPIRVSVKRV